MAKMFAWDKKYSVNVASMDQHHQQLFQLLADLHNALMQRKGREIVRTVLSSLLEYTEYHFSEEEKLMVRVQCNGLAAHKEMHREFIDTIKDYEKKADEGMEAFITTSLMVTLNDWLVTHIGRVDKLYSESMNNAGIY